MDGGVKAKETDDFVSHWGNVCMPGIVVVITNDNLFYRGSGPGGGTTEMPIQELFLAAFNNPFAVVV